MTNEIIETGTAKVVNPLCVDAEMEYSVDQVNIIRKTIAPNLTDDELKIFLYHCVRTRLDCFARQIYAIKRGGKMCIQTGIDGFRLIAERTGKYSPGKDTEFLYDANNRLLGAKVYVRKLTADGTWHDISATALVTEYNPGQGLWGRMPHVMIEKCAEARALRRAFPADLSGLLTGDEMEQADAPPQQPDPVPEIEAEPRITDEEWKALDEYINGHDDVREKLTKFCKLDNLRNMNKSQLEACRLYARGRIDGKNDAENDDK